MPIYEYRCRKCGNVFEEWVKTFDSPELKICPECGGDAGRILSQTSFQLEGGGWFASCYGGKKPASETEAATADGAAPAKEEAPAKGAAPAKDAAKDAAPAKAEATGSGGKSSDTATA